MTTAIKNRQKAIAYYKALIAYSNTCLNALLGGADMLSINQYALPDGTASSSLIEQYQRSLEMRVGQLVSVGQTSIIGAGIECANVIAAQTAAMRRRELRHTPTHARQGEAVNV